jgi:hypothetical protein
MEPHLAPLDKRMFYRYLDQAHHYLEFGSGGSTFQACMTSNIESIESVESDARWHEKVARSLDSTARAKSTLHLVDLSCQPGTWGYPGKECPAAQMSKYSNPPTDAHMVDLVLIDGRFRVACCLKLFPLISDDCRIVFDDFIPRKSSYNAVLNFFEVVDSTSDERMVVLKKRRGRDPPTQEQISLAETQPL